MNDGLQSIHVTGFRSLADVTLRPGPLTVLVGPNGSGKSNLLRVLRLVRSVRTHGLQKFVAEAGGASTLLHYGPKTTDVIGLRFDLQDGQRHLRYDAEFHYSAGDSLVVTESLGAATAWEFAGLAMGSESPWGRPPARAHPDGDAVADWLSRVAYFHFHDTSMSSALRTNARAAEDRELLPDGGNLAAYLLRLSTSSAENDQKAWRRINALVSRIAPGVEELSPTPVNSAGDHVRLDWVDDQGARFGVHQLSDGTLRAIALVTALAQPVERLPRFISIDEPELGLHPSAIAIIAALARSVSRHTQILFATQSTAFLDHFEPAEIVVVEREEGQTVLRHLSDEDLASWLEDYTVSEVVLDKGVFGGRP